MPIQHTDQLERVARAICAARGQNPDDEAHGGREDFVFPQHNGQTGFMSSYRGRAWEAHAKEAAVFIAAFKAI